jgi:hypothetical protein
MDFVQEVRLDQATSLLRRRSTLAALRQGGHAWAT